jgi:hypothetical protein
MFRLSRVKHIYPTTGNSFHRVVYRGDTWSRFIAQGLVMPSLAMKIVPLLFFVHFVHDLHQGFAFVFVFGVWVEESELVSAWGIEI